MNGEMNMDKDNQDVVRYARKIGIMGNSYNIRPKVLEAFFNIFEEDESILEDLRVR